jgi:hypothetical protein
MTLTKAQLQEHLADARRFLHIERGHVAAMERLERDILAAIAQQDASEPTANPGEGVADES